MGLCLLSPPKASEAFRASLGNFSDRSRSQLVAHAFPPHTYSSVSGKAAPTRRKGLAARSLPIVVVGPCPLMIATSSPKGAGDFLPDRSEQLSPTSPGGSVRPTEPVNSTWPTIPQVRPRIGYVMVPG